MRCDAVSTKGNPKLVLIPLKNKMIYHLHIVCVFDLKQTAYISLQPRLEKSVFVKGLSNILCIQERDVDFVRDIDSQFRQCLCFFIRQNYSFCKAPKPIWLIAFSFEIGFFHLIQSYQCQKHTLNSTNSCIHFTSAI